MKDCRSCNDNTSEDEAYFMLDCTLYTSIRQQWFKDIIRHIPVTSWIQMNNSDIMKLLICSYPRQTAKYLVNAFLKRRKRFTKV